MPCAVVSELACTWPWRESPTAPRRGCPRSPSGGGTRATRQDCLDARTRGELGKAGRGEGLGVGALRELGLLRGRWEFGWLDMTPQGRLDATKQGRLVAQQLFTGKAGLKKTFAYT
eukprot:378731-Pleurochrysis_carterae.AAC.1